MAFSCGFFNSKGLDRTYTAENFTEYLSSIICNGILDTYGQNFKLTAADTGLIVVLGTGKAWIDGHYFVNDSRYTIDLSSYQDESLPRFVTISILLDIGESVRNVSLEIIPSTPAENPSLPTLPTDENKTRLLMYAVRLNPGATELSERDWYDYRDDRGLCGYCRCILGKCKVTDMQSQIAQLIAEVQENNDKIASLTNKVNELETGLDDIIGGIAEIGTCGDNIHYILYENGKLLLHGSGATYDYDVGKSPFWERTDIRSLVVSEGITAIGKSIFERCSNMKSVSFPTTLESIDERAFFMYSQGGLTSLNIPSSVTTLGEKAFADQDITSVVLPDTLTTLGTYIFMGCSHLAAARVECAVVPDFCFVQCGLTNLTLSHNVKKIGSNILNYTTLKELTYEGSLEDWAAVTKYSNWDNNSVDTHGLDKVVCLDGYMEYDRETGEWKAVKE